MVGIQPSRDHNEGGQETGTLQRHRALLPRSDAPGVVLERPRPPPTSMNLRLRGGIPEFSSPTSAILQLTRARCKIHVVELRRSACSIALLAMHRRQRRREAQAKLTSSSLQMETAHFFGKGAVTATCGFQLPILASTQSYSKALPKLLTTGSCYRPLTR